MAFFHEYPYTDMHELNLDWIINEIKQIDADLKGIEERATQKAVDEAKKYVDVSIADVERRFNELSQEVNTLHSYFDAKVDELQNQYIQFIANVDAQLTFIRNRIDALDSKLDAEIVGVNARTDLAIAQNNDYIFSVISEDLPSELKVLNLFTGVRVSMQEMFNYLANLHITDGITYDALAGRNKTYAQLQALTIDYTQLATHGNSLVV